MCSTGGPKMKIAILCILLLFFCLSTKEMVVNKTKPYSRHSYQKQSGPDIIRNFRRHSDGTFTSDFINNLDRMKAKDFVEWLTSIKQEGCREEMPHSPTEA